VALDVHAEDLLGVLLGLIGGLGDLDAAGLASATGLDLRLDDGDPAALGADSSAAARASAGVVAVAPASTGTPCCSKMSRAWYS
jgi:hypothetical protein